MSKKDLLERMSRAQDGRGAVRRVVEGAPETRARPEAVKSTRVSRKVIRRRRKDEPVEAAPAPAPAPEHPPVPAARVVEAESVQPAPTPPTPTPTPAPVPAPVMAQPVVEAPVVEVAPAPPVVAEVVVPKPTPEPVAVVAKPVVAAPTVPKLVAPKRPRLKGVVNDGPQLPGLGPAVVSPPPGYDPTNPQAYRRHIDAQKAAAAAAPAAAATPAPGAFRGRRRVEPGGTRPDPARRAQPRVRGRRNRNVSPGQRPNRRRKRRAGPKAPSPLPAAHKRRVKVHNNITVGDLAQQMGVKATLIIKHLMADGMMVTVNEVLDLDTTTLIASEFDYTVENVGFQEDAFLQHVEGEEEEEQGEHRAPVVTVMGHVDHGKTTLLDAIRKADVVDGEAGGITQHIGAYQVEWGENSLTFLDTPGHAAFTAMRARGADITDIVVLVVAADDGVQPQTVEAINHAVAAGVPIVVAVNKCDKDGVNPDAIRTRLSETFDLTPEEWGGETLFANVSALKGEGIDDLIEMILLQAEMLDLTANADRHAEGVVIESKMERGRGAVATLLVQAGTLKRGDHVVIGAVHGRVRAMINYAGKTIKEAPPSTPVEVFGLSELPMVGDPVNVVKNEKNARKLADHRGLILREASMKNTRRRTAEDLFAAASKGETETLHLVLKCDVGGTLQALLAAVQAIEIEGTEIRLLHAAVGPITESDVNLVAANGGLLVGFNVKYGANGRKAADEAGVDAQMFDVIYHALDHIEARMKGMLAPTFEERHVGTAEVRAVFDISRTGRIAGCYIVDGKVVRGGVVKVKRDNELVHSGKVSGLKRFKDDVREVGTGFECGISIENYDVVQVGDVLETFELVQVERV
jgi:translation initiation factor IF-2